MGIFSKKPKPLTESEAIAALNDGIKRLIKEAREAGLPPQRIANALTGYSAEIMQPIYEVQQRRQFA
jgi:hypothetical protein